MLFRFLTTGKLGYKDFLRSIGEDALRMLIKISLSLPARGLQSLIANSFTPGLMGPNPDGSALGGNSFMNLLGTAGSSIMSWGGAGSLLGSGLTSLGGMFGGAFGSGLAMTGQVGIGAGFMNGLGALGSGGGMASLGAMLPGIGTDSNTVCIHMTDRRLAHILLSQK